MARIDPIAAGLYKKEVEAYNEWKKDLSTGFHDKDGYALRHVIRLEERREELEEKLERYEIFFATLRDLIPKTSDIHHNKLR